MAASYYDAPAVLVKEGGRSSVLFIHRDYLGSILQIADASGHVIEENSFDAWGCRRNPYTHEAYTFGSEPRLLLGRGYTGHEHLSFFGIINMNARLYDPISGRFLSPDPYVQLPDNTQAFNRYSYCMNNPLCYVDENGEFWHLIIGAAIGGVVNWATDGFKFNAKGLGYFATGAVTGIVGAGIGAGISSAIAGGSFGAGFIGSSTAMTASSSFVSGAAIGGGAGFSTGFTAGIGNGLIDGKSFGQALWSGAKDGLIGGTSGILLGGIAGGIDAAVDGRNFWHGGVKTLDVSLAIPQVNQAGQYDCSYIANTMNANKTVVLSYKTGVSGGINAAGQRISFAHATVVTRVRMYDNGRFIINVMNPGGSTTRLTNARNFNLILEVY